MTPDDNSALIRLNGISKHYQMGSQLVRALDGISVEIGNGDWVSFIGSSGSGKSTILNILGCLDRPTDGEYYLNGVYVEDLGPNQLAEIRNREIGFIFQSFNLLPRATALGNVMQPLVYSRIGYRRRKDMAREALRRVGLDDRIDHLPNQLSGGQRQRVAIARALVTEPSILLADEPTGNLDSRTSADIMQLFDQLHREGQTLILVTHEEEVAGLGDRVIELLDGKIIRDRRAGEPLH
ncbi:MAG: ABC transporter ATP-binding protein [Gammaproteobacteria bacterium]|nr:ABC transporter ATP-binding protein [Gammaproteobacteria bacterium]MXZ33015.1 ABC transporter ATP-binding protein [Gammaproteobacteria bacterium]MYE99632.1 ABC transporter ATP-binding protein [Gammaproteobacteria bacterium]MYG95988.1 ABC transporter ATP-binding protein [Gammaproteobacteria bacterium]